MLRKLLLFSILLIYAAGEQHSVEMLDEWVSASFHFRFWRGRGGGVCLCVERRSWDWPKELFFPALLRGWSGWCLLSEPVLVLLLRSRIVDLFTRWVYKISHLSKNETQQCKRSKAALSLSRVEIRPRKNCCIQRGKSRTVLENAGNGMTMVLVGEAGVVRSGIWWDELWVTVISTGGKVVLNWLLGIFQKVF